MLALIGWLWGLTMGKSAETCGLWLESLSVGGNRLGRCKQIAAAFRFFGTLVFIPWSVQII